MAYLGLISVDNNMFMLYYEPNSNNGLAELNCFFLKPAGHIRCYHEETRPQASDVLSLGPARGQRNFSLKIRERVGGKET